MKLVNLLVVILSCIFSFHAWGATPVSQIEVNKRLVREFYELAFNQHKPTEAAKKYIGNQYIQHNPFVPDGAEPFYSYFEGFFKKNPESRVEIKRVLGDGNLVILHIHSKLDTNDRGRAVVDIFRVENGKIVEHWDVAQEVPEASANSNTMF